MERRACRVRSKTTIFLMLLAVLVCTVLVFASMNEGMAGQERSLHMQTPIRSFNAFGSSGLHGSGLCQHE
jgi:hypothetical protein